MGNGFYERLENGLNIRIRLTPSGRAMQIDGVVQNRDGQDVLKAIVTTAPENGKANQALVKLLAKEWKLAKSTFEVLKGQTSRNKVLHLSGDANQLANVLDGWAKKKG